MELSHDHVIKMKISPGFSIVRLSTADLQNMMIDLKTINTIIKRKKERKTNFIKGRIWAVPIRDTITRVSNGLIKIQTSGSFGLKAAL